MTPAQRYAAMVANLSGGPLSMAGLPQLPVTPPAPPPTPTGPNPPPPAGSDDPNAPTPNDPTKTPPKKKPGAGRFNSQFQQTWSNAFQNGSAHGTPNPRTQVQDNTWNGIEGGRPNPNYTVEDPMQPPVPMIKPRMKPPAKPPVVPPPPDPPAEDPAAAAQRSGLGAISPPQLPTGGLSSIQQSRRPRLNAGAAFAPRTTYSPVSRASGPSAYTVYR